MRLRTKSVSILSKIPNGMGKIPAKTPWEVAREDGVNTDIDFKKRNKLSFSERKNCEKKKSFPMAIGNGLYLVEPH